jgi:acyl-CoA dehydrogenase
MSMSFTLSKPLLDYTHALREWSVAQIRPYAREADARHAFPENWAEILGTSPVPLGRHDKGGQDSVPEFEDGYWVGKLSFNEAIAYGDLWGLFAISGGIGHLVVEAMGSPWQVEKWYKPIVEFGSPTGFALTEPHFGSDTSQVATTATRDGDHWVLNGTKIFCSNGSDGEYVVVFATVDRSLGAKGITAFVVPKGTPGFIVAKVNEHKMGIRSWKTSELLFDNCRIPEENVLGWSDGEIKPRSSGLGGALGVLGYNRPNIAALSVGVTQASLDLTAGLLAEQKAGFSLHRWSLIEDQMAAMNYALERGRRVTLKAQALLDRGRPDRAAAATAKAYAPQTCERIIRRCMQLLGPEGASEELLLEKWYRDVKIMDIFEGSGQIQRIIVGRELMGRVAG